MGKDKLSEVGYLILSIIAAFFILIGISKAAHAQQTPVFVECTAGEFPAEITWQILTCNGSIILEGGAPYFGAAILPQYYQINMQDSYGDGWNGAYLHIDEEEYGFLSNVDWIDSLGTWPQEFTQQLIDVGCLTIGIEELEGANFIPHTYYDLLGRNVIPSTGLYFATDGILTKKVYIDEIK